MPVKRNYIITPVASAVVFLTLALLFDRNGVPGIYPGGTDADRQKPAILDTINAYNSILSDIYTSGGVPAMLNEFPATKAVKHGLFRDIGFIRDMDRGLVYDLAAITPVDVKMTSPATAEVVVLEEWNYMYQRKNDRLPVSRMKGMGQGFRYRLKREHGKWIVYAWDPVSVEAPAKKGHYF